MSVHVLASLGFNQLSEGDEWESPRRTITETDVVNFSGISGDFNPIHVDHESAKDGPFGKPVAHGLLGLAVVSGLGSYAPRVDTLAFLGILEWHFRIPIFFGDTVHLISHIESLEPKARGRRGIVTWRKQLYNQHGKIVQEGRIQTLVKATVA